MVLLDQFSPYVEVACLKTKDEAINHYKRFMQRAKTIHGRNIQIFRVDGGGEFNSTAFQELLEQEGTMIERTMPHSSQENSQAERIIRSLFIMARCMLYYAGAPIVFWREALHFAAFVHNRTLSKSNINSTPYELWHGNKPDFSKMRIFGCAAHAIIPKEQRHKLSDKAVECIFVGYCTNSSGYVCIIPPQTRFSRAVTCTSTKRNFLFN